MRALVWHAAGDLRVEDVPEPAEPRPGEAVVEVSYCGICGTDLSEYRAGPLLIRPGPHPLTGEAPPFALGHELSGRVVALGDGPNGVAVGDRVTVDPCWSCGTCFWCRRGEYHICRVGGAVGLASSGALAEYVKVPSAGLVPLPDHVDDRVGALVEPLAVGLHAVARGGVRPGDTVLVSGFGPIGAAVLLAAVAAGASLVAVAEPLAGRRQLALDLGATVALDPAAVDVRREVFRLTERVGPDVVFECTGVPALLASAVETARRGGRVVVMGVAHGAAELAPNSVVLYERTVVGSLGYNRDLQRVVDLLAAARLRPERLVTGTVPLDDAVPGAFDPLLAREGDHLKVLVQVGA